MCGIFVAIESKRSSQFLISEFMKLKHRGPDASDFKMIKDNTYFGFHRLAINGLTTKGNQPMYKNGVWLVANAEIFNYLDLAETYGVQLETGSDCEILIDLYQQLGEERMLDVIDGEFAFVLYDECKDLYIASRDHLGVRGMYMGYDDSGVYFASESKALAFTSQLDQFPPGHYWNSFTDDIQPYFYHDYEAKSLSEEGYCQKINELLTASVEKRMMSERPLGCLLSGGLDSSLVAGILARKLKQNGKQLETFSIGLEGSPDIDAALKVADYIGSKHHSIICTEQEFLTELEDTVYMLGSYDVTTVRASVGHQLVSKYVRDHSEVKVLFSGETADEFGSYLYFQNAPDAESFQLESVRLLKGIQYFDMKRGDRSISNAGLEARVPFADKAFVNFFMSIPPELRMFSDQKIEKYLIRKAFEAENLIPEDVLWRRKNGFSDSVSSKKKSWSEIIKDHIESLVTDEEFKTQKFRFSPEPASKEAFYYLKTFEKTYGSHFQLTPYQWLPKWCGDIKDPSARVLDIYQAD